MGDLAQICTRFWISEVDGDESKEREWGKTGGQLGDKMIRVRGSFGFKVRDGI